MRILLVGASGMIGQGVLRELLGDPDIARVVTLGRARLRAHGKLEQLVATDFADAVTGPLFPLLARLAPGYVTTTGRLARGLIALARREPGLAVLEQQDLNKLT